MINVFPSDKQSHVRTMLSTSLRGVVSQQLLQRFDNRAACSPGNPGEYAGLAEPDPPGQARPARDVMQAGGAFVGMRTMDTAIQQLLDSRQVTGKEAYKGHQ